MLMEFFSENVMWLLGAYLAGSFATYFLLWKQATVDVLGKTIDQLVDNGFLRHRKNVDGEIEILKWDADEEEVS